VDFSSTGEIENLSEKATAELADLIFSVASRSVTVAARPDPAHGLR
jgi:hypothetical protein